LESTSSTAIRAVGEATSSGGFYNTLANAPNSWAWFLIGALTALLVLILWNMGKTERRSVENGE